MVRIIRMPGFNPRSAEADYLKAGMIADPINLMDASPMGDGAAAIVLLPADSNQLPETDEKQ